jgi:hypothetical protein
MSTQGRSRRVFLIESVSGLGGVWVAANYAGILDAQRYVLEAAQSGQPARFAFFTPDQVVYFIDRALTTFDKDRQGDYTTGLGVLASETKKLVPSAAKFSALTPDQQVQVLTAIEKSPFFELVRTHTITGFFASPVHGGNAGKVGWKLVNYDDSLNFKPPFGYYDALPPPRR